MPHQDLREFIALLEERGELHRIKVEVDPALEIAAITARISQKVPAKALFFEDVKGHSKPVLTNLFGSIRRVELALQTNSFDALAKNLFRDLEAIPNYSLENRLKKLLEFSIYQPYMCDQPICQEIIQKDDPHLLSLPILKAWPEDGGPYITLPMIFTKAPVSEEKNCGMYRVQIFDDKTVGIRWGEKSDAAAHFRMWQKLGEPMPVAIALGGDPILTYAAGFPLPSGLDEVAFAGYLRQVPVSMAQCLTNNLQVPSDAEIVIEGLVDPAITGLEGPFGNHTGYYVEQSSVPLMRVTAITHRRNAIYPCTVVGRAPMEDCYLAKATERLLLSLLKIEFPVIQNINFPMEGVFHGCALLSLTPEGDGTGRDLIRLLWQQGFLKHSRLLIVYNHEVDLQNPSEAYWHAINQVQGDRDIMIDGGRVGIDATVKDHRISVKGDPKTLEKIANRWVEYGFE